jgi:hypothetical protein
MKKFFHCLKLFFSLNPSKNCLEYLTSKTFKIIIILISIISKLPQIYYMINFNNILSLNYISIYFEIIYYVFHILFPYINNNNIFTYIEYIIILCELIFIFLLNWKYSQDQNSDRNNFFFSSFLIIFVYLNFKIEFMSKEQLKNIFNFSIILLIISRINQIKEIINEKNSGPLSSITFICHCVELVLCMIIEYKEIDKNEIIKFKIFFYLFTLFLNFSIVIEIIYYSNFKIEENENKENENENKENENENKEKNKNKENEDNNKKENKKKNEKEKNKKNKKEKNN